MIMVAGSHAIVAISSPPGRSLRGLIRVSGGDLSNLARRLFGAVPQPRVLTKAKARPWGLPCLVMYFPGPNSFTGEDVIELQLPGNPALLERAVQHILTTAERDHQPMRLAEAGEFTRRAFLAGKIDLTQAEGIAATISATSDAQLQAAKLLRGGRLGRLATNLVDELGETLALVEAGIDFTDQDDVVAISPPELDARLATVLKQINELIARSRLWSVFDDLPWVVLVGPPNAGKSTLFNALLGHERAVTSDKVGTTRDVLCEPLRITDAQGQAAEVMLVDVAGLTHAEGMIDVAMQDAAVEAINRADLVLSLGGHVAVNCEVICIGAKADVVNHKEEDCDVVVSAHTGEGMNELRQRMAECLGQRAVTLSGEMLALQPRHSAALHEAEACIAQTRDQLAPLLDQSVPGEMELIASHMRVALDALGELGGQLSPDDVLGKVFATFCIGK